VRAEVDLAPDVSAHDGIVAVCQVILAKEACFLLLNQIWNANSPPNRVAIPSIEAYHQRYGIILDVEDTASLRAIYRDLRLLARRLEA
jgi:hypothetical protein